MLRNFRKSPVSSKRRSRSPGYWRSRSSTSSPTSLPLAYTSPTPPVCRRSGVGIRTSTGILGSSLPRGHRLELGQHGLDRGEARAHAQRPGYTTLQGFDGLQTAARDADYNRLVAADAALCDELPRGGEGHAARRLREDSLRPGQELHRLDDLLVRRVRGPAARLPHRLGGIVAVGGVPDGEGLRDGPRSHGHEDVGTLAHHRDDGATAL